MTVKKYPREALADILRRLIGHVEKYDCTMSMEFDGISYRVSVTGEGELKVGSTIAPPDKGAQP